MSIAKPDERSVNDFLHRAILKGIKEEVEREFEAAKKQAIESLDKRKAEVIAGIVFSITKMTEFQSFNDRVIFTVKTQAPSQ